jgi:hypothetical protein
MTGARPFAPGDRVLLVDPRQRRYMITLEEGKQFHSHQGSLAHDDLIGLPEGTWASTHGGARMLAVRPTLSDYVLKMRRGAQVVYPKDMALIVMYADVFPGARVVTCENRGFAHANTRVRCGRPIATNQAIQWMIADSEIELRSARWLLYEAAWKADRGEDCRYESSSAKVFATEIAGRVVDRAIQIHGGLGVAKENPFERWYRELRIKRIGEGPSEVHRMVVARDLLSGRVEV